LPASTATAESGLPDALSLFSAHLNAGQKPKCVLVGQAARLQDNTLMRGLALRRNPVQGVYMSLKSFGKAFATLAVSMLICGNAYGAIESDRAVMLSPAKDGAYVVKMLGLTNNKKIVLLNGARKTIHDGIVIRASKVENGKIIIPAGGMYTTSRCSNWWSFNDHTFTAAGKLYHFITDEFQQDVVKNVTMKKGEMVFGNEAKTRGWQLTYLGGTPYGVEGAQNLEFKIVKTTGNDYGTPFLIVAVGPHGYWKVVIDEFDGKTVKAWHIETAKDKTDNLAGRAKGKHIDAVVGAECRSTGHFFSRVYKQLYKEAVSK
jgi:hypothetical protein